MRLRISKFAALPLSLALAFASRALPAFSAVLTKTTMGKPVARANIGNASGRLVLLPSHAASFLDAPRLAYPLSAVPSLASIVPARLAGADDEATEAAQLPLPPDGEAESAVAGESRIGQDQASPAALTQLNQAMTDASQAFDLSIKPKGDVKESPAATLDRLFEQGTTPGKADLSGKWHIGLKFFWGDVTNVLLVGRSRMIHANEGPLFEKEVLQVMINVLPVSHRDPGSLTDKEIERTRDLLAHPEKSGLMTVEFDQNGAHFSYIWEERLHPSKTVLMHKVVNTIRKYQDYLIVKRESFTAPRKIGPLWQHGTAGPWEPSQTTYMYFFKDVTPPNGNP